MGKKEKNFIRGIKYVFKWINERREWGDHADKFEWGNIIGLDSQGLHMKKHP